MGRFDRATCTVHLISSPDQPGRKQVYFSINKLDATKKRCWSFEFRFKEFRIKQAIFPSLVKVPKQKNWGVFCCCFRVFEVFARFNAFSKFIILKTFLSDTNSNFCLLHYFFLQSFRNKIYCWRAKISEFFFKKWAFIPYFHTHLRICSSTEIVYKPHWLSISPFK